ncbi:hypothetical protein GCM10022215_32630 [Nocardioides fonticola]|uniref:Uncharacterized protein n=1 Tax=Nocardioides fonticola TaxID=450363 RepID=A0ABP7XRU7_9ACTN
MSRPGVADLRVVADLDPAVWLANPAPGTEDTWAARALDAVAEDFGLTKGSPGHELMREVIDLFAHAEPVADLRFLRARSPLEPMPVVWVHLLTDDGSHDRPGPDRILTSFDPAEPWYDAEPHVEVLDPTTGLRRAMMVSTRDGVLRTVVRHHRREPVTGVDILVSCAGLDLRSTALVMADLDTLAASLQILDPAGIRR